MTRHFALWTTVLCVAALALAGCNDGDFGKDVPRAHVNEGDATTTPVTPTDEVADPADGVEPADTTEPADVPAPVDTAAPVVYVMNENSSITFEGSKTIDTHVGGFSAIDGTITLPGGDPTKAVIEVNIDMTSLFSDNSILTTVLKTGEWFAVEKHPGAVFRSTAIEPIEGGFRVSGDLVIKDVTKNLSFDAKVGQPLGDTLMGEAKFIVNRKWWGVGYDDWKGDLIKDDVVLELLVEADLSEG
jgi:polyisoprenoid-binding protein YceI